MNQPQAFHHSSVLESVLVYRPKARALVVNYIFKNQLNRVGEMAQCLGLLVALPQDPT